jgi:hypothetical protein
VSVGGIANRHSASPALPSPGQVNGVCNPGAEHRSWRKMEHKLQKLKKNKQGFNFYSFTKFNKKHQIYIYLNILDTN